MPDPVVARDDGNTFSDRLLNQDITEIDDYVPSGGFNVEPVDVCPHAVDNVCCSKLPFEVDNLIYAPCSMCGDTRENMICGHCLTVCCGRHVKAHMLKHHESTGHPIVIGTQDLSFW